MRKLNKKQIEILLSEKIQKDHDFDSISDAKDTLKITSQGMAKLLDFISYNVGFIGLAGVAAALKHINLEDFS